MKRLLFYSIPFFLFLLSCHKENEIRSGSLALHFNHVVDGQPVVFKDMRYTNTAGNQYEITEIMWFASDVVAIKENKDEVVLPGQDLAHYIDTNLPHSLQWKVSTGILPGSYKAIKFTFGLKGVKNIPGQFTNLPESDMIWPYALGGDAGGYHYMKLNGFWMNTDLQRTPFNVHLGVGQTYHNGEVTGYIQNWLEITLPVSFVITENFEKRVELTMHADRWFDTPHTYDHNVFGGMIMKNQQAMKMLHENGHNVFTIRELPE